jgi:hypothetical protein
LKSCKLARVYMYLRVCLKRPNFILLAQFLFFGPSVKTNNFSHFSLSINLVFGWNIQDLLSFKEEFGNIENEYSDEVASRRINLLKRVILFVFMDTFNIFNYNFRNLWIFILPKKRETCESYYFGCLYWFGEVIIMGPFGFNLFLSLWK